MSKHGLGAVSLTQMWENAGLSESSQYKLNVCVTTATIVMSTRRRQYWKTDIHMI